MQIAQIVKLLRRSDKPLISIQKYHIQRENTSLRLQTVYGCHLGTEEVCDVRFRAKLVSIISTSLFYYRRPTTTSWKRNLPLLMPLRTTPPLL